MRGVFSALLLTFFSLARSKWCYDETSRYKEYRKLKENYELKKEDGEYAPEPDLVYKIGLHCLKKSACTSTISRWLERARIMLGSSFGNLQRFENQNGFGKKSDHFADECYEDNDGATYYLCCDKDLSAWAIALIVIACLVVLIAVIVFIVLKIKSKKAKDKKVTNGSTAPGQTTSNL